MGKAKILEKRYLVGIPIPSLDRKGRPLRPAAADAWTRKALDELTACFGGATPVPAPGVNIVQDRSGKLRVLFEQGQTLVISACSSRAEFRSKRSRIRRFAEAMATALRQEAVCVLAFPSDSFLVVLEEPTDRRKGRRRRI